MGSVLAAPGLSGFDPNSTFGGRVTTLRQRPGPPLSNQDFLAALYDEVPDLMVGSLANPIARNKLLTNGIR